MGAHKKIRLCEQILKEWKIVIICLLFKKGDPMDCHNYREITLLNVRYKILSSLILNKIKSYTEGIIGNYPTDFRSEKLTIEHILTLR